jgi:hypothetical protein
MESEMTGVSELRNDVDLLKTLYTQRGSIHHYLQEVFRIRNKWQKRTTFAKFKKLTAQVHGKPFDQRITGTRVRILIELSCPAKTEKKSEYSAAVNNARKAGYKPEELSDFLKKKGGIRKAAYG